MSNVFKDQQNITADVPRSTFDKSHQNNLTMRLGALTPVYCQEVLPGDSIRIQPTFGLRFMPMVFPIQTRMRAYMHFYYCRNRSVWKDWQDFIYSTKKGLTPPYLGKNTPISFKNGEIADYMGIPTQYYGYSEDSQDAHVTPGVNYYHDKAEGKYRASVPLLITNKGRVLNDLKLDIGTIVKPLTSDLSIYSISVSGTTDVEIPKGVTSYIKFDISKGELTTSSEFVFVVSKLPDYSLDDLKSPVQLYGLDSNDTIITDRILPLNYEYQLLPSGQAGSFKLEQKDVITLRKCKSLILTTYTSQKDVTLTRNEKEPFYITTKVTLGGILDYNIQDYPEKNPYRNGKMQLSSLPFRHYESIYNFYYRNQQSDPFKINGEIEHNKYVTNDEGGEDNYLYKIEYRNWELDQFTSCVPSPQADGILPPMVGITTTQDSQMVVFRDEDGFIRQLKKSVKENGEVGFEVSENLKLGENPQLIKLQDVADQGITIEDFRFVNAMQKFLEMKIRRGYRYKDLTKGYYNVDIKYDELNIPEFIGGVTQDVQVNSISSTSATEFANLADYAGQATCVGQSKPVQRYADEHGFIIGILCVVPNPVYSQNIPKHFLKKDPLDYYFPHFANIGYQPVLKEELAPLQWFNQDKDTEPTFGYQRAWYDYVASLDQVHGDFRSSLRNFVMNRVFNGAPQLGKEFLKVDPKQLNDVFVETSATDDKILGEIYFDVKYKTSVPYVSVPSIE